MKFPRFHLKCNFLHNYLQSNAIRWHSKTWFYGLSQHTIAPYLCLTHSFSWVSCLFNWIKRLKLCPHGSCHRRTHRLPMIDSITIKNQLHLIDSLWIRKHSVRKIRQRVSRFEWWTALCVQPNRYTNRARALSLLWCGIKCYCVHCECISRIENAL